MIRVKDISKSFKIVKPKRKTIEAVKEVSFEVEPGTIYGLLGPNGAGKTTVLRMIATLLKPEQGSIEVLGHSTVSDARIVRSKIGFLTSDMKLTGALTPREILRFFGELNHLEKSMIEERIDYLAQYLSMAEFLEQPIEKLSVGQKQKTSISVALLHDPEVILFDEPTAGLDILSSRTVVNFLLDFKSQGKSIILSTHIMAEAEKLCDHIGIMLKGQIHDSGTVADLCQKTGTSNLDDAFFAIANRIGGLEE